MNIQLIPLQIHGDDRGSLIALEDNKDIPFPVKRVYYMFDTKSGVIRGLHAHKNLRQLIVAVRGSCRFLLDDGRERVELFLNNPAQGLLVESMVWREMRDFSEDCVLMILASEHYSEHDYIRDYDVFIKASNCK